MIPVSEYKNPFWKKFFAIIFCLPSISGIGCVISGINENDTLLAIIGAIIGCVSIYGIIRNAYYAQRIRQALTAADIEELTESDSGNRCQKSFLIVSKNNLLGLFDKKTRSIVLPPEYMCIEAEGSFYKIQGNNEKNGVFSCDLKKRIIPCEYDYVDFSRDNCLRLAKESTIYKFSFSGELLDQHYYGEELDRMVDGLSAEQLASLAQKKDY